METTVTTASDYRELIKNANRGHFPRVLTTDGFTLDEEFMHNYNEWQPDHTVISHISNSDDWPSFRDATEMRRAVRRAGCKCSLCVESI